MDRARHVAVCVLDGLADVEYQLAVQRRRADERDHTDRLAVGGPGVETTSQLAGQVLIADSEALTDEVDAVLVVVDDEHDRLVPPNEPAQPRRVESMYRYVSNIFSTAVKDGVIAKSPCFDIDLPTVVKPRVKLMATEEVETLLNAMPARYRALVVLGAGAGLRQGEAFGVTVPHVSFTDRVVHVEQQLQVLIGKPPFLKTPKRESHRDVPGYRPGTTAQ